MSHCIITSEMPCDGEGTPQQTVELSPTWFRSWHSGAQVSAYKPAILVPDPFITTVLGFGVFTSPYKHEVVCNALPCLNDHNGPDQIEDQ